MGFTEAGMRALFERVMDAMALAGWLRSHRFITGHGFHLVWTERGAERAATLRQIIRTFGLLDGDPAPVRFDKLAQGDRLLAPMGFGAGVRLPDGVADYWCDSVGELKFPERDEDTLLGFVHVLETWAPDAGTETRFGHGE